MTKTLEIFSSGETSIHPSFPPPAESEDIFYGLSDYQCNDPLGNDYDLRNPYCKEGNLPRNWPIRPKVPEVRRFYKSGDNILLTEGLEYLIFYGYWNENPSWPESYVKDMYGRNMRDDAAFTNKVAWNSKTPRKSVILGVNPKSKPMALLGIVCPGGNIFRKTGNPVRYFEKDGKLEPYESVWNLDYRWLAENITKSNAREFAEKIPSWLKFYAKIVHPVKIGDPLAPFAPKGIYRVTNWDGNFWLPMITDDGGETAVVDGFHVKENWLIQKRLSRIRPNA